MRNSLPFRVSALLAAPTALLTLAGFVLLAVAPFTWGVAEHVDVPAWMIPACDVILSLPPLVIGAFTTSKILRYTARPHLTFALHLPFALPLLPVAGVLVWLATRIADSTSYDHLRDTEGGTFTAPAAVLLLTLVLATFFHVAVWACATMYAEAFSEERPPPRDLDARWFEDPLPARRA